MPTTFTEVSKNGVLRVDWEGVRCEFYHSFDGFDEYPAGYPRGYGMQGKLGDHVVEDLFRPGRYIVLRKRRAQPEARMVRVQLELTSLRMKRDRAWYSLRCLLFGHRRPANESGE